MDQRVATQLGRKLRLARKKAQLSQAEVARRTGLSESFIRMVENGRSDISLSRLLGWTAVFGIPIGDLFGGESHQRIEITRVDERVALPLDSDSDGVAFFLLTPALNHALEPGIFRLDPGTEMSYDLRHDGEESLFVLFGHIRLSVEDSDVELKAGDAAYYRSTEAHRLANLSQDAPAEVLVTATHPAVNVAASTPNT